MDLAAAFDREYRDIEVPGGRVRLQSFTAADLCELGLYPEADRMFVAIALAVVDDHGKRRHVVGEHTFDELKGIPKVTFEIIADAVNSFCLAETEVDEHVKKSEAAPD